MVSRTAPMASKLRKCVFSFLYRVGEPAPISQQSKLLCGSSFACKVGYQVTCNSVPPDF